MRDVANVYDIRLAYADGRLRTAIRNMTAAELAAAEVTEAGYLAALLRVSRAIAPWIIGAQRWITTEATAYLRALSALVRDQPYTEIPPYMPGRYAGTTAAGIPMPDLTALGVRAFERLAQADLTQAVEAAQAWWDTIATSEPHRAGNGTILDNAETDDRLSGRYFRVTEPNACDFCRLIADRGYVWAGAGFPAHPHCRCEAIPEMKYEEWNDRMCRYTRTRTEQIEARQRARFGMAALAPAPAVSFDSRTSLHGPGEVTEEYRRDAARFLDQALGGIRPEIRDNFDQLIIGTPDYAKRREYRTALKDEDPIAMLRKSGALAYTTSEYGVPRTPDSRIVVRGDLDNEFNTRMNARAHASGWSVPVGDDVSLLESTLTHEVGHFLHEQVNLQVPPRQDLSAMDRYMIAALGAGTADAEWARQLFLTRRIPIGLEEQLTVMVGGDPEMNMRAAHRVRLGLSEYGASEATEMMAEGWCEYKLSPEPRPIAIAIGRHIESVLGIRP